MLGMRIQLAGRPRAGLRARAAIRDAARVCATGGRREADRRDGAVLSNSDGHGDKHHCLIAMNTVIQGERRTGATADLSSRRESGLSGQAAH